MAESFVQVAPDSTGKKLRTRQRTVGSNTIEEQYVIVQGEAVVVSRTWLSSLRVPNRALAAAGNTQPLMTVWNGIASGGNNVSVRRLSVEVDSAAALTTASPVLRLLRMSTQAGTPGGTVITPVAQYSADAAMNALISVRADHQADGVAATTALAAGTLGSQPMWSQTVPRWQTLAGYQSLAEYNMLPNDGTLMQQDPLILRPQEGFCVQLMATAALATAGTFTFMVKAVLGEFTYP